VQRAHRMNIGFENLDVMLGAASVSIPTRFSANCDGRARRLLF
jgi:hypothetical protein